MRSPRVALSKGVKKNDFIQCPFHGLEFNGKGECQIIPANSIEQPVPERYKIKSYQTYESHGFIWIFWGDMKKITSSPYFFTNLDGFTHYKTVRDPWKTHYSRVIENQLDVAHVPFVHKKTIGRGGRTVVDGPKTKWTTDDKFHLYVYNRVENGTLPLKPDQLENKSDDKQHLEFVFPNL